MKLGAALQRWSYGICNRSATSIFTRLAAKRRELKQEDKRTLRTPSRRFVDVGWFPMERRWSRVCAARRRLDDHRPAVAAEVCAEGDGRSRGPFRREGQRLICSPQSPSVCAFGRQGHRRRPSRDARRVCEEVSQHERPYLRRYYDKAWQDLSSSANRCLMDEPRCGAPDGFGRLAAQSCRLCVRSN